MDILDLRDKETIEKEKNISFSDLPSEPSNIKKAGSFVWEVVKIVFISLVIIIPIRMFVIQPFIVEGASMLPNFNDGEYLIVDEISYRFQEPKRGDVVIFHPPQSPGVYYIKRIISLPGETVKIEEGKIIIYNAEHPDGIKLNELDYSVNNQIPSNERVNVVLDKDEYYMIGDNRTNSLDSRSFGAVKFGNIKGRAWVRAFPFPRFTIFNAPTYNFN